jgi:RNA-directed DNA polymerase
VKCGNAQDVPKSLQPVAETPRPLEGLRTRMSLESNAIWTERMLEALETGVKGGRWFSLMDKVWNPDNLRLGAWQVIRNEGAPGVDHRSYEQLQEELSSEVELLERQLREGTYRPRAVKRVWIEKLGSKEKRPLGIPTVRDRVVQATLRNVIEPIFEAEFEEHSYGFRPGRGATQAINRVEKLLKEGQTWVVDADIKGYFDNIPQDRLMALLRQRISDGGVLTLIEAFLQQGVMESGKGWQPTTKGTPQGAVLSPMLANLYLHPLDQLAKSRGWQMTRYADDFIVQCSSQEAAERTLAEIREWMDAAELTLHPEKTRIVDATIPGGFDFLGWHFERGYKWPRKKSLDRFKETLREETQRNSGNCLPSIIARLNRRLRGWYNYFRGGVNNVYQRLDEWLRGRLRGILRRRDKRKGRGRGLDHHRYPIAYFANLKLISLYASACETALQPRRTRVTH